MKAFNLRGTNGTGKTFVARELIRLSGAEPYQHSQIPVGNKPIMYRGMLYKKPLYILGSYVTQCGGCDTIPSVKIVAGILRKLRESGEDATVFYEGLMISHMIGTVGAEVKPWGDDHVMGFLDTPLDVCIERVKRRRLEKGNLKPFDPGKTLVGDHRAVQGARRNALMAGFKVVDIDYLDAVNHVLERLELLNADQ